MIWRAYFFGATVVCSLLSEEVPGGVVQADKEPNVIPAKNPGWPSLEEQLSAAKVVRGSALEQLIRENQDFRLLRPEEAGDKLGLPPWLRVYWRKHHPKGVYSADDPTGGYPRVLKNLYGWMVLHQDLPSGSP
jgi:hypothetical protein